MLKTAKFKKLIAITTIVIILFSNASQSAFAFNPMYIGGYESKGLDASYISFMSWSGFVNQTRWAIDYSANQWNNRTGNTKLYHSATQTSSNTNYQQDGYNKISKISLSTTGVLMNTHVWATIRNNKAYITEADIVVNSDKPWNNNGGSSFYDVQNCMTHEMGHMLGLGHSQYSNATMYDSAILGETSKRTIEQDDINAFNALYS